MQHKTENSNLFKFLANQTPHAVAKISGGKKHPNIRGLVEFYSLPNGVIVTANIDNLPTTPTNIFAFHIHSGTTCDNNFANTGEHFNLGGQLHPNHAGDLPPLFSNAGSAFLMFFDQRFKIENVIGRVVIIHDNPDDFTTQPSGNSGEKIACGVIERV